MINTKDEFVGKYFYDEEYNIVGVAICANCGFEKLIVLDESTIDLLEIDMEDIGILEDYITEYEEFTEAPRGLCHCDDCSYILIKVVDKYTSEVSVDYRWINIEGKNYSACLQHTRPKDREVSYIKQSNKIEIRCYVCGKCVTNDF